MEAQPLSRLLAGKTVHQVSAQLEGYLVLSEVDEAGSPRKHLLAGEASHDRLLSLQLQEVIRDGGEYGREALQELEVGGGLVRRGAEEDNNIGSTPVDLDASRADGDEKLRRRQTLELRVRDGDAGIHEQVVLAALASEGRVDLGPPGRERRAEEKLLENSREWAASIEHDPIWTQELVDHGRTTLSLTPPGTPFEYQPSSALLEVRKRP